MLCFKTISARGESGVLLYLLGRGDGRKLLASPASLVIAMANIKISFAFAIVKSYLNQLTGLEWFQKKKKIRLPTFSIQ